ncbi:MAG: CRISPR-associated endonuclease Cas1 [Acidobacteria bacterium]|nr:CRISPR-associated endonuclease Cas1 [Acidobacteriota bacterium]
MPNNPIPPFDQLEPTSGILVIDGYGIALKVHAGHLVAIDGSGRSRRQRRYPRAAHKLNRVVLIGHSGYVTLEALRWLTDQKIPYIHIDDGELATTSTRLGVHNARLRRAQAYALTHPVGMRIAKGLLHDKIRGQQAVARLIGSADFADEAIERLDAAVSVDQLLVIEASAAVEYWSTWNGIPVRFVSSDKKRVPDHWLSFQGRSSPLGGNKPRSATNPINAILNYLYALLAAETRIACHAVGLDPALGILHSDTPNRDSLAADLMEVVRPQVDAYVLELLAEHRFSKKDFVETRQGGCRLARTLTHQLTPTTRRWSAAVAPVAERISKDLASEPDLRVGPVTTPLTQTNRRNAAGGTTPTRTKTPKLERTCLRCGDTPTKTGIYCRVCAEDSKIDWIPQLSELATRHLAVARASGNDPAHGGEAAAKRGETNRRRQDEIREWEESNERPAPERFDQEILPRLQGLSAGEMATATGLSRPYCSMIKRGAYVPHPKHWDTLAELARGASNR